LKRLEAEILSADEKLSRMEQKLFDELRTRVLRYIGSIQRTAGAIAELDLMCSFAQIALEKQYVRPVLDSSDGIDIIGGRHPVVEASLGPGEFVPNDARLGEDGPQICIITGPNMAGKSTYLRQVGMIVLLSHMGCYVPAEKARVGLVDRIFTRIGAADDIASGQSTFLVEMDETASILRNLSGRSLILLDEIGRGTSTYDGLSIAWAVAEYLHELPACSPKTLFATHYHELTELAGRHDRIRNLTVQVKEHGNDVIFLRKICEGSADRSYGIHVASLAGLPAPVVKRAEEILKRLEAARDEEARFTGGQASPIMQLKLFEPGSVNLREELLKVNPESLTPLEALRLIDEWRKKYR
jgi:DNA mismatch repair protein MutS